MSILVKQDVGVVFFLLSSIHSKQHRNEVKYAKSFNFEAYHKPDCTSYVCVLFNMMIVFCFFFVVCVYFVSTRIALMRGSLTIQFKIQLKNCWSLLSACLFCCCFFLSLHSVPPHKSKNAFFSSSLCSLCLIGIYCNCDQIHNTFTNEHNIWYSRTWWSDKTREKITTKKATFVKQRHF